MDSVGFSHDAELPYKKLIQKIKGFWRNFVEKNQVILLALKIFGLQGFPLKPGWGGTPPISQK